MRARRSCAMISVAAFFCFRWCKRGLLLKSVVDISVLVFVYVIGLSGIVAALLVAYAWQVSRALFSNAIKALIDVKYTCNNECEKFRILRSILVKIIFLFMMNVF